MYNIIYRIEIKGEPSFITGLCLFRETVTPKWEDPVNQTGGEFSCMLKNTSAANINKVWEKLVFRTIGDHFKYPNNVCISSYIK